MTSPLPPEVVDVYEAERLSDPVYLEAQRARVLDWLNVAHQHELACCNEWSYYGKAADLITTLTRDLAAARAEAEGARRDAERWRHVNAHAEWIRADDRDERDKYALLAVRLPYHTDLSSMGARTDAIDAALQEHTP